MKNSKIALILVVGSAWTGTLRAEETAPEELDTVLVSASLPQNAEESARPVTVLSDEELLEKLGNTIGETLKQEPGVSSQSFGPGVGTPVIRGQSGPRVRVMQNGIGNNDVSTLSPDHANSAEPLLAERIEVLRGPSTLLYGSGAIGGIVNVIDNRIPEKMPDKLLGAALEQRYNSVANETASVIKLEGGKKHFAYHVDGFYRDRDNLHIGGDAIDASAARATDPSLEGIAVLQNSHGAIPNTNARTRGGSLGFSAIGEPGFAGVALNHLENTYGVPPDGSGGDPIRIDMRQTKYDFKGELEQPFALAEALRLKFGYTDYRHVELANNVPGTVFTNRTYESRLELLHVPFGPFKGSAGFQSINSDFAAIGEEAIVPQSKIDSYGLFAVESLEIADIRYEFGVRVEYQSIAPEGEASREFLPLSGSASVNWDIDKQNQVSFAVTQSQRAPQVQELFSNGVHEATRSFEVGNPNLRKEVSYNLDLGYRFKAEWMRAEINLFHNWVNNYIYAQRSGEVFDEDLEAIEPLCSSPGACLPVYQTTQNNAIFKGYEAKLVFPLMENHYGAVDLTLFSDYTRGTFVNGGDVPRLPPLRYGLQLDYLQDDWSANLRLTRGDAQTHAGANESDTPGYLLLDIGADYRLTAFDQAEVLLFAKGSNLLNENIRNSASYLRNFAPEPGRGAQVGIRINY
ncbi:MAG: TonB-dependent receptor [Gammaproteobacteria bacterium]